MAAHCDITAAISDIRAAASIAFSVTEPQWAQSFWDRSAERTCCFQSCFQGSRIFQMATSKALKRWLLNMPGSSGSQAVGGDHQVPAEEIAAVGHSYEMAAHFDITAAISDTTAALCDIKAAASIAFSVTEPQWGLRAFGTAVLRGRAASRAASKAHVLLRWRVARL